jgi:hypothetical protein
MVAGAILTAIGIGVVLMNALRLPGYWMPLIIGIGLLIAGVITWVTSRDIPR